MEPLESPTRTYYRSSAPFYKRNWARYSFFFLAGLTAGVLLLNLVRSERAVRKVSDEEVRGTIYSSGSFEKMKPADVIFLDDPALRLAIDARYSTQLVEARLDISTLFPVRVMVEFSYNDLRLLNLQNLTGNDQATTLSASNYVQIDNVGENKYIIQWLNRNNLPHQIWFRFYREDVAIYSNSVMINKE